MFLVDEAQSTVTGRCNRNRGRSCHELQSITSSLIPALYSILWAGISTTDVHFCEVDGEIK